MVKSPYIYWQYPAEPENRILGADHWTIEEQKPQYGTEHGKIYQIRGKAECVARTPPSRYKNFPLQFTSGEIIDVWLLGDYTGGIYNWQLFENRKNMNSLLTYTENQGGNGLDTYCNLKTVEVIVYTENKNGNLVRCKANGDSISEPIIGFDTLHDIKPFFLRENPRRCIEDVPDLCTLSFYKTDGSKIYERVERVCPEVWHPDAECPEGTCSVECGNHICCYDNLGYSVAYIQK